MRVLVSLVYHLTSVVAMPNPGFVRRKRARQPDLRLCVPRSAATVCGDGSATNLATCTAIGAALGTGCHFIGSGPTSTCVAGAFGMPLVLSKTWVPCFKRQQRSSPSPINCDCWTAATACGDGSATTFATCTAIGATLGTGCHFIGSGPTSTCVAGACPSWIMLC